MPGSYTPEGHSIEAQESEGLAQVELPTRVERWDDPLEVWRDLRALHEKGSERTEAERRHYCSLFERAVELDGSSFETVGKELMA